tara:strand:+ start:270 stop:776 length:507 start_codon:yes stop_codon:yes gene_type:complete
MKEEVKQEKESLEKLTDDIKSLEKKLQTSRDERDKVGLASEQGIELASIIRTDQESLEDLRQRKDQATYSFEKKKEELEKLLQKQSEGVGNIENPIAADEGEEKENKEGGSIHSNNGAYIRPRVRRYSFKVNKKKKINKQKKKRPKHKHSFRLKKKTNNSSKKRNNTK